MGLEGLNSNILKGVDREKIKEQGLIKVPDIADAAIGEALAGIGNNTSTASIEETSDELADLMDALGKFEEDVPKIGSGISISINGTIEDINQDRIDEQNASFNPEEASAYAKGEVELQARIDEAIENNPDMDPEAIEKEIREAYALENPEWAAAEKEANEVQEKHDKEMDEAYSKFCEENPQPKAEDFDTPEDFLKAQDEWNSKAKKHMDKMESRYEEDNPSYRNLQKAKREIEAGETTIEKLPATEPEIIKPTASWPIDKDPSDYIIQEIKDPEDKPYIEY